jgi:hypothetical protein
MKRYGWLGAAAVAGLGLTGCIIVKTIQPPGVLRQQEGFDPATVTPPNPFAPNVFVTNGYPVLDQEPIVVPPGTNPNTIIFALPKNSGYKFPLENAVTVVSVVPMQRGATPAATGSDLISNFNCTVALPLAESVTCTYRILVPDVIKYTITVVGLDGKTVTATDPHINNW